MQDKMHEWVVMPCYNEAGNIYKVIKDVQKYCNNLVVVDDGSKDNTYEIAEKLNGHVLRHAINLGKGSALRTGADFAIKHGAKKLVFIDSDGQHEAKEIPTFLRLLDDYDIIFGARKLNKNMPLIFRIGNFFLTQGIYLMFGIKLMDTQSGYRSMTAETYGKIKWTATDYSVESEMIANTGKNNLRYKEIPISTIYHNRYKGTTVMDGIKIMFKMILYRIQK
jgi:UDP-N-acetylglucosamine---dolichyl-phosphate N-acetylglucosaminyltransferase